MGDVRVKKVLSALAFWFGMATGVALAQAGTTPAPSSVPYVGTVNASQVVPSGTGTPATFGGGTYNGTFNFPTTVLSATGTFAAPTGVALNFCPNNICNAGVDTSGNLYGVGLVVTNPVTIGNGGTGSSTKNFVDLTSAQTIAGLKTWSNLGTFSGGISTSTITTTLGTNFFGSSSTNSATSFGSSVCSSGYLGLYTGTSVVVAGVTGNAFEFNCTNNIAAMDTNGNVGFYGSITPRLHLNQNAAGTWATRASMTNGTYTFTFPTAFSNGPVCTATEEVGNNYIHITANNGTIVTVVSSVTTGNSDGVDIMCVGNPN